MSAVRRTRFRGLALLVLLTLGVDQLTKWIATRTLGESPGRLDSYLGDTLRLQYALNRGAFLGLGGGLTPSQRFIVFTVANAAAMLVLAVVLVRHWNMRPIKFVAGALILGGGLGNLIDRAWNDGRVTDFLNVGIGQLRTGIFNVADMAIMAGCGLLMLVWWREPAAGGPAPPLAANPELPAFPAATDRSPN
jgi:signal peptidase II